MARTMLANAGRPWSRALYAHGQLVAQGCFEASDVSGRDSRAHLDAQVALRGRSVGGGTASQKADPGARALH
jgi:hypothetical protein